MIYRIWNMSKMILWVCWTQTFRRRHSFKMGEKYNCKNKQALGKLLLDVNKFHKATWMFTLHIQRWSRLSVWMKKKKKNAGFHQMQCETDEIERLKWDTKSRWMHFAESKQTLMWRRKEKQRLEKKWVFFMPRNVDISTWVLTFLLSDHKAVVWVLVFFFILFYLFWVPCVCRDENWYKCALNSSFLKMGIVIAALLKLYIATLV